MSTRSAISRARVAALLHLKYASAAALPQVSVQIGGMPVTVPDASAPSQAPHAELQALRQTVEDALLVAQEQSRRAQFAEDALLRVMSSERDSSPSQGMVSSVVDRARTFRDPADYARLLSEDPELAQFARHAALPALLLADAGFGHSGQDERRRAMVLDAIRNVSGPSPTPARVDPTRPQKSRTV